MGCAPGLPAARPRCCTNPSSWDKLSVIAGLTLWNFYFRIHEGSIRGPQAAEFLETLLRHIPGKLLVIWDGAAIHRSQPVKAVLAASNGRLWLERLPAYAPELIQSSISGSPQGTPDQTCSSSTAGS
ncbi:MAG: transposase [Opitutaceae bacterium]|nr:transposase [Opitutaceae bacterium]